MTKAVETYACLYAKEFPAQALLRLRPELQNKACVVMEGKLPLQTVFSLNAKARLLGIERGMTQVEVETFPEVEILTRSQTETAAKAILLECAGALSPRIEDRSEDVAEAFAVHVGLTSLSLSLRKISRQAPFSPWFASMTRANGSSSSCDGASRRKMAGCSSMRVPRDRNGKLLEEGFQRPALHRSCRQLLRVAQG